MNPNNFNEIRIHDDLDESDFSAISLASIQNTELARQTGTSFSSFAFQIGEKFGELKKEVDGIKGKIEEFRTENLELKAAKEKEKCAFDGLKEEVEKMKEDLEEKGRAMAEMKEENKKFKEEIGAIKDNKAEKDALANLPEQITNLEKLFKFDFIEMKDNKLNSADCGPKLAISEGELIVKHSGPTAAWNTVRAQLAIPNFNLIENPSIAYFEVEILQIHRNLGGISIGFCTKEFLLEGNIGLGNDENEQNSIGIGCKGGIFIEGFCNHFRKTGHHFQTGEVIGIGILHLAANSTMKCFATWNGNLLELAELSSKFASLQLFPAVSMFYQRYSIRANFGADEFRFNPREVTQNSFFEPVDNLTSRIADFETRFKFGILEMKDNKWNWGDCGSKMAISDGGLVVKHFGPLDVSNCVRAHLAIPKFNLNTHKSAIAYFEVEILVQNPLMRGSLIIGFCTRQFPLEDNGLGFGQNSIGIGRKRGLNIDGTQIYLGNNSAGHFQAGEVIGLGIVHFSANSKMKCFVSCNGNLLGMADLPQKFANLELFPAINLFGANDSLRANFAGPFLYNSLEILQNL